MQPDDHQCHDPNCPVHGKDGSPDLAEIVGTAIEKIRTAKAQAEAGHKLTDQLVILITTVLRVHNFDGYDADQRAQATMDALARLIGTTAADYVIDSVEQHHAAVPEVKLAAMKEATAQHVTRMVEQICRGGTSAALLGIASERHATEQTSAAQAAKRQAENN